MTRQSIFTIYDKIFKKILTLSSTAIVNLINGLFGTDYPTDSEISYNWTEFEDDSLKKILADTIITINGMHSYHIEAQMNKDNNIIFRVFEYGFAHANRNINHEDNVIYFPEPMIIYLYYEGEAPDEYVLTLDFGTQGTFDYKVKVFKYLDITTEELNNRKMVILIPFMLLKLRKLIQKERSEENLEQLKKLIQNDIIGSIEENLELGNITYQDAHRLRRLTHKLYTHIYARYDELEVLNEMTDQSLILDIDEILDESEERIARVAAECDARIAKIMEENDEKLANIQAENDEKLANIQAENDEKLASIQAENDEKLASIQAENDEKLASIQAQNEAKLASVTSEKDSIIAELKKQIEEMKNPL